MRFGFGLITCQRYPGDPRTDVDLYREGLEIAEEAERLGFDSVWNSEHHFADDAYMPSVLPFSAAVAARTRTISMGTGLALAPMYNPLRLAEDASTIDLISQGRFHLGLGMGWLDWEFDTLGIRLSERVRDTVRAIETCRQAWGTGLVERSGVSVTPKPARAGGPPIWIGAHAEPAVRRAARLADGWMAGEESPDEVAERVRWIQEELTASGRDRSSFTIAGYWPVFVWRDPNEAWNLVRDHFHYMEWKYEDAESAKGRLGQLPSPPALDSDAEEELRSTMICGNPDQVAERIGAFREAVGQDLEFIGRMYFPGMSVEIMKESASLFANEVIPRFKA